MDPPRIISLEQNMYPASPSFRKLQGFWAFFARNQGRNQTSISYYVTTSKTFVVASGTPALHTYTLAQECTQSLFETSSTIESLNNILGKF
jgi:hypothetical protein